MLVLGVEDIGALAADKARQIYEDIGWGKIEQIPVPALALGLPYAAIVARLTRASMLEVIRQDYVRTA